MGGACEVEPLVDAAQHEGVGLVLTGHDQLVEVDDDQISVAVHVA